jgi:hypothetical protein
MTWRSGSADLPLHGGRVPKWLGDRMTRLGAVIAEAIIREFGRHKLLRRLANPFWFQIGALMGMDWHSSGITTSDHWCAEARPDTFVQRTWHPCLRGRGSHSRQTPHGLVTIVDRVGPDGAALSGYRRTFVTMPDRLAGQGIVQADILPQSLFQDHAPRRNSAWRRRGPIIATTRRDGVRPWRDLVEHRFLHSGHGWRERVGSAATVIAHARVDDGSLSRHTRHITQLAHVLGNSNGVSTDHQTWRPQRPCRDHSPRGGSGSNHPQTWGRAEGIGINAYGLSEPAADLGTIRIHRD